MVGFADATGQMPPAAPPQAPAEPSMNPAAPPPAPAQGGTPPAAMAAANRPATPQQQEDFNKFYGMATVALFDDQFWPGAVEMMRAAPDPVDAMARVAASIGTMIYMRAFQQGSIIEPIVVVEAGRKFMGDVAQLAMWAGLDVTEGDAENAYYIAADMVRNSLDQAGMIDQQAMEEEATQAGNMVDRHEFEKLGNKVHAARLQSQERARRAQQ